MTKTISYTLFITVFSFFNYVARPSLAADKDVQKTQAMKLKIGDKAPDFQALDQHEQPVQLSDFIGQQKLILYFYPKDNTPFCTMQAKSLRDSYEALQGAGYEVIGVSSDSNQSHQKFIKKHELPFRLIADEDHALQKLYGVRKQKSILGMKCYSSTARTTFVIDLEGRIEQIIEKVKVSTHAAQILGDQGKSQPEA